MKGGDVLSGAFPGTTSSVPLRFAGVDDGDADSVGDDDSSDSSSVQVQNFWSQLSPCRNKWGT